mgnify:CR=1 FL=1
MTNFIRQFHRWTSVAFTLAVLLNIAALMLQQQAVWIGFLALAPLIVLMLTGLYMFALPYVATRRGARERVSDRVASASPRRRGRP